MTHPTDQAITRFAAAHDPDRAIATPADELHLALRPDPRPTPSKPWLNPGFGALYLLTNAANALVRIGSTDRLRQRFTEMNCAGPVDLAVAHFLHVAGAPVAKLVETDVQTVFRAHCRRGEWFDVPVADAAQEMADVLYRRGLPFWTEPERREIGLIAGRIMAKRAEMAMGRR